jgi:hypothetical protein
MGVPMAVDRDVGEGRTDNSFQSLRALDMGNKRDIS